MKKLLLPILTAIALGSYSCASSNLQTCFDKFHAEHYHQAILYGKKAVKEQPNNPKSYFCLGIAYTRIGQIDKAIKNLKKASQHNPTKQNLMAIYNFLGSEYESEGYYNKAILYEKKSLKIAKELNDTKAQVADLNNIAIIVRHTGDIAKAVKYLKKALKLHPNAMEKSSIYNNMAVFYEKMGNYNKAVKYLKKSIDIDERLGEYLDSGEHMLNLGSIYSKMKDYKDAKIYLEKGLKRVKKVGNKRWEGTGYGYLGLYYSDIGNKQLAKKYFTKSMKIFQSIKDYRDASTMLLNLATLK